MRAMILAAGRGNRLRPLTDTCPKPLIQVGGKPLIAYHIENLKKAGISKIIINVSHLAEKIQDFLGDGEKWDVAISYSFEPTMLEVGGGIFKALPLLGQDPFIIVNGDIWTDYPIAKLPQKPKGLAHLVLVDNPPHNQNGDYGLQSDGRLIRSPQYTYSGISVLAPELFKGCQIGAAFRLAPVLDQAMRDQLLYGEYYSGSWTDVGSIERLQSLEKSLAWSSTLVK
ncbi:MAG: N-acetylmuramate alpha-1-phosphate uridylyltransferase MurU [Candidatus Berkiellales bacterium]